MKILAIIPARKNSKGIKNKNRATLLRKPLISYTFAAAHESKLIDRVVLSSDDAKLGSLAKAAGIEMPFIRPSHLALDATPMIDVLRHALNFFRVKESYVPDAVVLLQPTSPLRSARHIDEAIRIFLKSKADSLVSVVPVPHQYNPNSLMIKGKKNLLTPISKGKLILRRQDKTELFARNGPAILISKSSDILEGRLYGKKCVAYLMKPEDSIDIDSQNDLVLAEFFLKKKRSR